LAHHAACTPAESNSASAKGFIRTLEQASAHGNSEPPSIRSWPANHYGSWLRSR